MKWEFEDGEIGEATLLVGADGIHSSVSKYLYPDLTPTFLEASASLLQFRRRS